tara:strand:- start:203 stop:1348 length:1146 start_codon:yes stop_codon:yes gene_type:complete
MYPTISHLIYDLFGINIPLPIQTFGFWVAMAFLAAYYVIKKELIRKEKEGFIKEVVIKETIGKSLSPFQIMNSLITGFLVGFKFIEAVFHYSDLVLNPQNFILSTRGNLTGGIFMSILFVYLKWSENKKSKLPKPKEIDKTVKPFHLTSNMILIAAISGIIGAKIFHNLENIGDFLADPIGQIISFSGLTFYGGLITGAIAVIWYTRKYKINTLHLIDSFAPALILAYGVGRIGCQLSGDGDWGIANLSPKPESIAFLPDWMWSFTFPHNVINAGIPIEGCTGRFCMELANPVWPTAFYEVIMSLLIFTFLWKIRKKITTPGMLFCIYLVFNGLERFSIEKIRINTEYDILGGVTQAEIISFCLIICGVLGSTFLYKKSKI